MSTYIAVSRGCGWRALVCVAMALTILLAACSTAQTKTPFDARLAKPIVELQSDLAAGRTTSEQLVRAYLARIAALDRAGPALRSIIALNPAALQLARELDAERRQRGARGPLHGIPILLKDNIESIDALPTTAGSLALAQNFADRDAPIVAHLRAAGAIILGKANLSEWANFRSERSISGWSALGGLTKNPHVLDRSACGSSAGSAAAVAALFAVASVGTETDGSITCPASMNGIVGLKPTLGLLAKQGIVPLAHSQDTAGPMARSVTDAALMLGAMTGSAHDYAKALSTTSLAGKRVGVWRFRSGRYPQVEALYEQALAVLRAAGATLIEVSVPDTTAVSNAEEIVLFAEFKADLNAYLADTPRAVLARSLEQLIEFNKQTPRELVLFGQELFVRANATASLDDVAYKTALTDSKRLAGAEGIGRLLKSERLDLIVAPTTGPAWRIDLVSGDGYPGSFSTLPAVSGYPHLTVPMGAVRDLPVGISFIGPPLSEPLLLGAGYAYEQRARIQVRPLFKPTIETEGQPALHP